MAPVLREKTEAELKNSRNRYHNLFNSMRDAILIADMDRKIVGCNLAFEELFGYSQDEIMGKPTVYVYEDEAQFLELGSKLQENIGNPNFFYTVRYQKKTGDVFPGETNVFYLRNTQGDAYGYVGQIRDVTLRNEVEKKLRKSEDRFSLLVENLFDTLVVVDKDGIIRYINRSGLGLFHCQEADLIGKPFGFPVTTHAPFEMEVLQKNGGFRYAEMRVTEVEWQGEPAYLASIRDITDQRLAREEREKLNANLQLIQRMEAIGTLAGGIAHDFNNILSPILGFTELALERVKDDSVMQDCLNQVYQAAVRAKGLVRQILAFSRQEESEFQPLLPGPIVKEALKMLRSTLPTNIEIRQKVVSEQIVIADATAIHQVLMNLCTNAKHAMGEDGGVLSVSLEDVELSSASALKHPDLEPGRYVRLRVSDTGCGMEASVIEKIFDPYFTTKQKGRGTGLGLAIVHGIIKKHRGAIILESRPKSGSVFDVYLPGSDSNTKEEKIEDLLPPRGDEHILLVDDEPPVVKLNQRLLEKLGYSVSPRVSSIEALELFKAKPHAFDLLLTDMTMPNLTGEKLAEACFRIRPDLPVILTTGFSETMDEKKAKQMGIRAFLYKPISKRELAWVVREVLDRYPIREED